METRNAADDRMTDNLRYIARNVKDLQSFNFQKGDIVLVTYPKCGTNWMKNIIWGILHKGADPPNMNDMQYECLFPQIEFCGTKIVESRESPRTLATHLPSTSVPFSTTSKYIHVTRNPFDCCISYHNFVLTSFPSKLEDLSLDKFIDDFLNGILMSGNYFEHVLDWYKHKDDENYLHITYEEMSKDHIGSILKVAKFLGKDYYGDIANAEELQKKIEYHSSFSFMKSLPRVRIPKPGMLLQNIEWGTEDAAADDEKFTEFEFYRRGVVGDFKETLSEEQKQKIRRKMEEKFRGTDFLHQWDGELCHFENAGLV